jgi:hypothetical protein
MVGSAQAVDLDPHLEPRLEVLHERLQLRALTFQ